jgi:chloride channel protein, CIC family
LRLLLACGAAAGFASAYDAPLSAAIFIVEIVYGTLVIRRLGPLMVASVMNERLKSGDVTVSHSRR